MTSQQNKRVLFSVTVASSLYMLLLICAPPFFHTQAQTPCPTIQQTGPTNAWAQNSDVTVDLDPRFSAAEQACIQRAFLVGKATTGLMAAHPALGLLGLLSAKAHSTLTHSSFRDVRELLSLTWAQQLRYRRLTDILVTR